MKTEIIPTKTPPSNSDGGTNPACVCPFCEAGYPSSVLRGVKLADGRVISVLFPSKVDDIISNLAKIKE